MWLAYVSGIADFAPLTYGDDDLLPPDVRCALRSVQFIAQHTKESDRDIEVIVNRDGRLWFMT